MKVKDEKNVNRQQWSEINMKQAINAIKSKQMGWLLASRTYNVPKRTLRRRVAQTTKVVKGHDKGYLGGRTATFWEMRKIIDTKKKRGDVGVRRGGKKHFS
ncbi:hypothetical protein Zmor_024308 [Zophobas morio]|uniref:HTH psq-type domain-containing protein n=1 Tax=Zophobas morio TaxID=2755281 RepID=A0AA38M7Z0_9CUCU|nr:hypothetical protein Zmor_024308 [Zophobas morio]